MRDLYIDADGTILNTSKALIECYSSITGIEAPKLYTLEWNMRDVFPNSDKNIIHDIFDSQDFINRVELFNGVYDALKALSKLTNIHIITVGTKKNLQLKEEYFKRHLPFCNYIGLEQYGKIFDKSCVKDAILVDDRLDNLESTINSHKVLFRYNNLPYKWQEGYENKVDHVLTEWNKDAYDLLSKLIKY